MGPFENSYSKVHKIKIYRWWCLTCELKILKSNSPIIIKPQWVMIDKLDFEITVPCIPVSSVLPLNVFLDNFICEN